jgi:hypothetical protein
MLSDLLTRLDDEEAVEDALIDLGDLRLIATLRQRAEVNGVGLGTFAAHSVRSYMDEAPDEEWVTLLAELHRSADPGGTFIKRALARAMGIPA